MTLDAQLACRNLIERRLIDHLARAEREARDRARTLSPLTEEQALLVLGPAAVEAAKMAKEQRHAR